MRKGVLLPAVMLLLGLAACTAAPPPPPPAPVLADPKAACLADLGSYGLRFEPQAAWRDERGCGIEWPVKLPRGTIAWNRPGTLDCRMAATMARFEQQAVQPIALKHFGLQVNRIHHAGTYVCRGERNGTRGRLSQHASGNAIDLWGFELTDGSVVSVSRHWRDQGPKGAFLHEVSRESCRFFNVVLTPNRDKDHWDHLHLDIGPYSLCGY